MNRLLSMSAILLLLGATNASAFDDQEIVDYRRHIMNALGEQAALVQMMVQKKAPAADFALQAQAFAVTASQAKKAFEPNVEGGKSKPQVWQNWADFAKRLDAMTAATAELAKAAKAGGLTAATPKVQAALECESCHQVYLKPSK